MNASPPNPIPPPITNDDPIADALVVMFTAGVGLIDWHAAGVLHREWALYSRMGRHFSRIVLVTWGGDADHEFASQLTFQNAAATASVLPFAAADADGDGDGAKPAAQIARALEGCTRVVVKTNQMSGGHVAIETTQSLRRAGIATALVARGGYPWSRFVAREHGPASPEACAAAAREGTLCRAADLIVGTTSEMVDDLAWRYELAPERLTVVPNYLTCESAAPVDRPRRSPEAMRTILFAGRLERQKRVDRLIEATSLLPEAIRLQSRLLIVGDGSQKQYLQKLAGHAGIQAEFAPRMPHEQLLAEMARCDVYAQVSDYEGHPKTVLEAMGAGAPVLVCDTPGLRSAVEDHATGLRVSTKASAIAAGLALLLTDEALAGRLSMAGAAHVREQCSLEAVAQLEAEAYRQAIRQSTESAAAMGSMDLTGSSQTQRAPATGVSFDPALLHASVEQAVAAWIQPIRGFARRLPVRMRAEFVMALDTPLYHLQGQTAVEADGGLHPKHRLMRYHDFFVDRIQRAERIIDLGSGVGALAASIAERAGATVVGIELSSANVESARARAAARGLASAIEYLQGDITERRAPGQFSTVVLSNVLEHITDRPERLRLWREWYGDPRFLIRVPAFDREWRAPWKKELGVEWRLDPTHETEYTQAQLEQELREAGLRISECIVRWGEYYIVAAGA